MPPPRWGTAEREQRRQEREEEKTAAVLARMERTEERVREQAEREQQFQREIALRQEEHEREWSERQDHAALERQREAWAALVQALVRCEDLLVQTDSNPAATARYIRVHRWADREDGVMLLRGAIRIHGASLADDLRERVTSAAVVARNLHRLQPDRVPVDDVYGDAENYERINARVKDLQAYFMYVRMSLDARRRSGSSLPHAHPPDMFRADLTPWPMPLDVPPQELADPLR